MCRRGKLSQERSDLGQRLTIGVERASHQRLELAAIEPDPVSVLALVQNQIVRHLGRSHRQQSLVAPWAIAPRRVALQPVELLLELMKMLARSGQLK
jgi:hypothetical protein